MGQTYVKNIYLGWEAPNDCLVALAAGHGGIGAYKVYYGIYPEDPDAEPPDRVFNGPEILDPSPCESNEHQIAGRLELTQTNNCEDASLCGFNIDVVIFIEVFGADNTRLTVCPIQLSYADPCGSSCSSFSCGSSDGSSMSGDGSGEPSSSLSDDTTEPPIGPECPDDYSWVVDGTSLHVTVPSTFPLTPEGYDSFWTVYSGTSVEGELPAAPGATVTLTNPGGWGEFDFFSISIRHPFEDPLCYSAHFTG